MKCVICCLIMYLSVAHCLSEVTLSCGNDNDTSRGGPGYPGKRGPVGYPGVKGEQGEVGDSVQEVKNLKKIKILKQNLTELERELKTHLVNMERRDCNDVAFQGYTDSGVYIVMINQTLTEVFCQLDKGDSWLVFQKRNSGDVDFYLDWSEYQSGFGSKFGEFWLGLDNLHTITSSGTYKLRVDLEDWDGNTAYAEYSNVTIGDSSTSYRLNIGNYSGTAGDSLMFHNNQQFSTKDQDHDLYGGNCAEQYHGAWWYNSCFEANLNGKYVNGTVGIDERGITWIQWKGFFVSMKTAEMKLQSV